MQDSGFTRQWWRLGGYFGIAFVVLFIIGIVVQVAWAGEAPMYDETVAEARAYWEDNGSGWLVGDYVIGLGFLVFFLPFAVILRELLGRAEGGVQVFSRTALLGAVLSVALAAAAQANWATLAFAAEQLSDDAVTTLMHLDAGAWAYFGLPLGVFLLAASLVIFMTGVVWRWLGILGAIIGVFAVLSPLSLLQYDPEGALDIVGFIAFIGLAVWLLLVSVAMILRKEAPMPALVAEERSL